MSENKALAISHAAGTSLEVVEDLGEGIDRRLGSVKATCPFCGGTYAAGYLDREHRSADAIDGEPQATIRHSNPPCERFVVNARKYLTDANRLATDRRKID